MNIKELDLTKKIRIKSWEITKYLTFDQVQTNFVNEDGDICNYQFCGYVLSEDWEYYMEKAEVTYYFATWIRDKKRKIVSELYTSQEKLQFAIESALHRDDVIINIPCNIHSFVLTENKDEVEV